MLVAKYRKGKYKESLSSLRKVSNMEIAAFKEMKEEGEERTELIHQMATTHSNMCAVYSQMGNHNQALKEINSSISKL